MIIISPRERILKIKQYVLIKCEWKLKEKQYGHLESTVEPRIGVGIQDPLHKKQAKPLQPSSGEMVNPGGIISKMRRKSVFMPAFLVAIIFFNVFKSSQEFTCH